MQDTSIGDQHASKTLRRGIPELVLFKQVPTSDTLDDFT